MTISANSIAHIRFGLGFRAQSAVIADAGALLEQLDQVRLPAKRSMPQMKDRLALMERYRAANRLHRDGEITLEEVREVGRILTAQVTEDFRADLLHQIASSHGLAERLVNFWADHFTVAARGRLLSLARTNYLDVAIRPNIAGKFEDLLIAAVTHAAMLLYLDQNASTGPNSVVGIAKGRGLNENLAREVLELHTLGVGGGYSQNDVREFAELLTGLRISKDGVGFNPTFAEPGEETVLGEVFGGLIGSLDDVKDGLRHIARQPATADHIARKLVVHFVQDTPDEDHVAHVSAAFVRSGGDLRATYAALLEHKSAWVPKLRKVRQPYEFVVAALRVFEGGADLVTEPTARELRSGIGNALTGMGQVPNRPPGPDGWPEAEEAWITPATLAVRIRFAAKVARRLGQGLDPRAFVKTALGDVAGSNTSLAVAGSETKWEGVALVLASPEFNRR